MNVPNNYGKVNMIISKVEIRCVGKNSVTVSEGDVLTFDYLCNGSENKRYLAGVPANCTGKVIYADKEHIKVDCSTLFRSNVLDISTASITSIVKASNDIIDDMANIREE